MISIALAACLVGAVVADSGVAPTKPWEYQQARGSESSQYPAWYQMPKPSPPSGYYERPGYERAPPPPPSYGGYTTYGNPRAPAYPDPVANNMMPALPPRKNGYYGGADIYGDPYESSISKYHPLLKRRKSSSPAPPPRRRLHALKNVTMTTLKLKTRSTTTTAVPTRGTFRPLGPVQTTSRSTSRPPVYTIITATPKLRPSPSTTPSTTTTTTTTTSTTTTPSTTETMPVTEEEETRRPATAAPPSRFICRHRPDESRRASPRKVIEPFRPVDRSRATSVGGRGGPVPATPTPSPNGGPSTSEEPVAKSILEAWGLWPNAELFAAIKDVVTKFKASLDESGLDQDVRHMGNQLRNTWQQLRAGLDRSWTAIRQSAETSLQANGASGRMDESLSRLFERAQQVAADAMKDEKQH